MKSPLVFKEKSLRLSDVWCFDTLPSTSLFIKETLKNPFATIPTGTCIWALEQSAGYGQRGNLWRSEPHEGLWFSFVIQNPISDDQIPILPQVVALALQNWIEEFLGVVVQIKHPNDLMWQNRKLAGILVEKVHDSLVIGIGINLLSNPTRDEVLQRKTASLDEFKPEINAQDFLFGFLKSFNATLWILENKGLETFKNILHLQVKHED